jgi:hypothetical protein
MLMARFQGNVHAGSDRVAATLLFLVLLVAILLVFWSYADHAGFTLFWDNVGRTLPGGR